MRVEVDLRSEHNFYTGLTQNISSGGLFIATNLLLPVGSRLHVEFTLPDHQPAIESEAEVRWLRDATWLKHVEGEQGMGVRLLSLPDEAQRAIDDFLKARESLFFEEE